MVFPGDSSITKPRKPRVDINHLCVLAHLKLKEAAHVAPNPRNFFREPDLFKLAFLLEKKVKWEKHYKKDKKEEE
jgi:hypothetical protein